MKRKYRNELVLLAGLILILHLTLNAALAETDLQKAFSGVPLHLTNLDIVGPPRLFEIRLTNDDHCLVVLADKDSVIITGWDKDRLTSILSPRESIWLDLGPTCGFLRDNQNNPFVTIDCKDHGLTYDFGTSVLGGLDLRFDSALTSQNDVGVQVEAVAGDGELVFAQGRLASFADLDRKSKRLRKIDYRIKGIQNVTAYDLGDVENFQWTGLLPDTSNQWDRSITIQASTTKPDGEGSEVLKQRALGIVYSTFSGLFGPPEGYLSSFESPDYRLRREFELRRMAGGFPTRLFETAKRRMLEIELNKLKAIVNAKLTSEGPTLEMKDSLTQVAKCCEFLELRRLSKEDVARQLDRLGNQASYPDSIHAQYQQALAAILNRGFDSGVFTREDLFESLCQRVAGKPFIQVSADDLGEFILPEFQVALLSGMTRPKSVKDLGRFDAHPIAGDISDPFEGSECGLLARALGDKRHLAALPEFLAWLAKAGSAEAANRVLATILARSEGLDLASRQRLQLFFDENCKWLKYPLSVEQTRVLQVAGAKLDGRDLFGFNSIGMCMMYIPKGEFQMGSPKDETGRDAGEVQHRVMVTKPFAMQATPVTQRQWKEVMGKSMDDVIAKAHPSYVPGLGDTFPMYEVTWDDAVEFCNRLSVREGRKYRLPTEAQWEYACRAGSTGPAGDRINLDQMAWYADNSGNGPINSRMLFETTNPQQSERILIHHGCRTHQVGTKLPNPWGLYDMLGNVGNWCGDFWGPYPADLVAEPLGPDILRDPAGPSGGVDRIARGHSWDATPGQCRAATRSWGPPSTARWDLGFRVVMEYP